MKLSYVKTTTERVEQEVPEFYSYDNTPRGAVVDVLLADFVHRGSTVRERLYYDDADSVEDAIHKLKSSYELADKILEALKFAKLEALKFAKLATLASFKID